MELFNAPCRVRNLDTMTLEKVGHRYAFKIKDSISGEQMTVILGKARMIELLMILHNELKDELNAR